MALTGLKLSAVTRAVIFFSSCPTKALGSLKQILSHSDWLDNQIYLYVFLVYLGALNNTPLAEVTCPSTVYPQGMVPVGHELPGGEAQRPGSLGDQAGNGTRKQFASGDVPEERLLHRHTVGNKRLHLLSLCKIILLAFIVSW